MQRQRNQIDPLLQLLTVFRTREFHENYRFICEDLHAFSPVNGVLGLDEDVQKRFYDVAYLFKQFAILTYMGAADEELVAALLRRRIIQVWTAIEPYVIRERQLRAQAEGSLLSFLERFAARMEQLPADVTTRFVEQQ